MALTTAELTRAFLQLCVSLFVYGSFRYSLFTGHRLWFLINYS
jgi:hypothetical protein